MATRGYYRHPTIHGDTIVFVSEDDLWSVGTAGGSAHRLTANPGSHSFPRFSPDGSQLAFVSRDEGVSDVFVMDSEGGSASRLTFFGATSHVVGWQPDGRSVIVATDHRQPFAGWLHLWSVPLEGGQATPMDLGPARAISHAKSGGGVVVGRNSFDPARWKRYRGGRAGSLWIDSDGSGGFRRLVGEAGNLADPMWIGRRVFFLSDHEGVGNLYSITPAGRSLTRHTDHEDFYARFTSTDGRRIVYHCGADIWLFDPATNESRLVDALVPSARPQRNRRFMGPGKYLEAFDLHPEGHTLAVTARGGAFTMPLWEGSVQRHGAVSRHRQRLAAWLPDGERIVTVTDELGEEALALRRADGSEVGTIQRDLGRLRSIDPAPAGTARVAATNHRLELLLIDLVRKSRRVVYKSKHSWIGGTAWSPDGRWLAFAASTSANSMNLFLYDTENRGLHQVGRPEFVDYGPSFDPEGKYLYFLSRRVFDPVPDAAFHDFSFPLGVIPMALSLQSATRSPFDVAARAPRPPGGSPNGAGDGKGGSQKVEVDIEGIGERVHAFPVPPARYTRIRGGRARVFLLQYPMRGSLGSPAVDAEPLRGSLGMWDMTADKFEPITDGVSSFTLSGDGKVLAIRAGKKLRVVPAGWKDDKNSKDQAGRESGWIDLDRIRIEVDPADEWRQMFGEAWRLQRDYFWFEDMGGVDWLAVHDRYQSLLDRVASRSEFSDLLWEMQGELGTSHAYELGGDYRPEPAWSQGALGADLTWRRGAWRVESLPQGDPWDPQSSSPLANAGVRTGDRVLSIDGVTLTERVSPESLLVDRGGRPVTLKVGTGRQSPRNVVVTPLKSEVKLRYRDWVSANRRAVSEATGGRAGYIHIPDMGPAGFAEFHRSWRHELEKDGLVIDVRFNRGGNVSQLLLQKLLRRRIGYQVTRWREPLSLPDDAPVGPMVCLTNEYSGSDGDIFSHTFKLAGLGPLIGTRTWGGVVGIWPQQSLVDGTVTTQPEFATWFTDVGYQIENYGTDPDIEVANTPQDYRSGRDRQLERGIAELVKIIEQSEPLTPDFGVRPSVSPPRLPR